jgi:outer membrane immunogenic protein
LAPNWYGRLEYRYATFGSERTMVFDAVGAPLRPAEIEPTAQTIRAGLSYKFGSSAVATGPGYKVPAAAPAYSWTGFHIGAGVGYGAYTTEDQMLVAGTGALFAGPYSTGGKGWLGTVIAGYDFQFTDRWVAGAFADYDFTSVKGEHNNPLDLVGTLKQKSAWAAGGRIGYLVTPSTLLYGTAGYTAADFSGVDYSGAFLAVPLGHQTGATYDGWFVGLGAETQLTANWYARLEYRYADYKAEHSALFEEGVSTGLDNIIEPTVQTVRAGLSYKFATGKGPVVAKY